MVSRHSAFYSPVIAAIAGGFLEREGIAATYSVLPPGARSHVLIREGAVDVVQSAVSTNWKPMERGDAPLPLHFAQINRRDGFFLVARQSNAPFAWTDLEGRELLADHGLQPLVMLRYAAAYNQVPWDRIRVLDAGTPEEMDAAFRAGKADFVHLQSPAAHRLEHDGVGRVAVSVGWSMPEVAFSSLSASREFLSGEKAPAFLRAYGAAKEWVRHAAPEDIAACESQYFPDTAAPALAAAIRAYQSLGCWEGGLAIPRDLYEQSLTVFEHSREITRRHPYDEVCINLSV